MYVYLRLQKQEGNGNIFYRFKYDKTNRDMKKSVVMKSRQRSGSLCSRHWRYVSSPCLSAGKSLVESLCPKGAWLRTLHIYAIIPFMKKLLYPLLLSTLLFSATPEQVEQYLSVSYAEEQLLTVEELEELLKIVKTPVMNHESKAVFGSTAYALKEFFLSIASRYDLSKHQR